MSKCFRMCVVIRKSDPESRLGLGRVREGLDITQCFNLISYLICTLETSTEGDLRSEWIKTGQKKIQVHLKFIITKVT